MHGSHEHMQSLIAYTLLHVHCTCTCMCTITRVYMSARARVCVSATRYFTCVRLSLHMHSRDIFHAKRTCVIP